MLIAAFRGTETKDDWQTEMTCDQENDFLSKGKFHSSFVKRANSISIDAILYSAENYEADKIITYGHSLWGLCL